MKVPPDKLRDIIAAGEDCCDFAEYGAGTSEEWISRAEAAIGHKLPPSFQWWLLNYRGGEILGEEVFSIYELDFDAVVGGDLVFQYRAFQQARALEPGELPICYSEIDGLFYLDLNRRGANGEAPVMSSATSSMYCADFSEFLVKRIRLASGAGRPLRA